MATQGAVGPFDSQCEDWVSYTERLQQWFVANDVQDANKQRAVLLSTCGASTYRLIRNLVTPRKPVERTFKQLVNVVKAHYCPPPSVTAQRFTFNSRTQREGETEFVAELRRLVFVLSLSYCVGLVYRHAVLVASGVELSNDFEADALVKLSVKSSDRGRIVTFGGLSRKPATSQPHESSRIISTTKTLSPSLDNGNGEIERLEAENRRL